MTAEVAVAVTTARMIVVAAVAMIDTMIVAAGKSFWNWFPNFRFLHALGILIHFSSFSFPVAMVEAVAVVATVVRAIIIDDSSFSKSCTK
jgi:hypothetical protein